MASICQLNHLLCMPSSRLAASRSTCWTAAVPPLPTHTHLEAPAVVCAHDLAALLVHKAVAERGQAVRAAVLKAAPLARCIRPQHIVPAGDRHGRGNSQGTIAHHHAMPCLRRLYEACCDANACSSHLHGCAGRNTGDRRCWLQLHQRCKARTLAMCCLLLLLLLLQVAGACLTHLPSSVTLLGLAASRFSTAATGYQACG